LCTPVPPPPHRSQVTTAHADGAFDILYDDGDREDRVPPGRVRLTGPEAEAAAAAAAAAATAAAVAVSAPAAVPAAPAVAVGQPAMVKETRVTKVPGTWVVGARVQGNYGGKGEFFPGKVLTRASVYRLQDCRGVCPAHTHVPPAPLCGPTQITRIEVKGLLKYYDILYDDGDIETKVWYPTNTSSLRVCRLTPPLTLRLTCTAPLSPCCYM
jgi:hypothetical protein